MRRPIITFTSDFGHEDWFVGVVHGVLYGICPEARVVDLAHGIPPGTIARAAFVLEAAAPDFPPGTIHLAVVDPGVGTARRALAVRSRGQLFVGPDNGILEWALSAPDAEARALTADRYVRSVVSRTFHGRDVFAPIAAHLACGVSFGKLGARVTDPVRLEWAAPRVAGEALLGRVAYIDRFGNALTNLKSDAVAGAFAGVPEARLEVQAGTRSIRGISRSYGDQEVGAIVALMGSSGRLEIAQVGGDAASRLGLAEGDPVRVRKLPAVAADA
jgi:S-adenosylmethionine hydrolase